MKGIFYSIVTMFLILPIVLFSFSYFNAESAKGRSVVISTLGDKLANYAISINDDLPRAGSIISQRAVQTALIYVDSTGNPLDDSEALLAEIIVNGTIKGNATAQGLTLESWRSQLEQKGYAYGFATSVKILNVTIKPLDSYNIQVNITVRVAANETQHAMKLDRTLVASLPVSINGFEDPLYSLETNGLLKRSVVAQNVTINGVSSLDYAVGNRLYMQSADGPSFLERLEGRVSRSPKYSAMSNIGLESVVNVAELQSNGVGIKPAQSTVDYLYFDTASNPGQLVNGSFYGWLRLDAVHGALYGVTLI